MLDRVQAGAGGEHPAGEDALDLALQRHLVDLDEGVGVGRLGRRPRIADARRHLQRAELHGLVDGDVERDDAAGDLVEAGEHRGRIGDALRRRLHHHLVARLRRDIARLLACRAAAARPAAGRAKSAPARCARPAAAALAPAAAAPPARRAAAPAAPSRSRRRPGGWPAAGSSAPAVAAPAAGPSAYRTAAAARCGWGNCRRAAAEIGGRPVRNVGRRARRIIAENRAELREGRCRRQQRRNRKHAD